MISPLYVVCVIVFIVTIVLSAEDNRKQYIKKQFNGNTYVELGYKMKLNDEDAETIAELLRDNNYVLIVYLELEYTFTSKGIITILNSLQYNKTLTSLTFYSPYQIFMPYVINTEDIHDLELKSNTTLTCLSFQRKVDPSIAARLGKHIASFKSLSTLVFKQCPIGDEGIKYILNAIPPTKQSIILHLDACNLRECSNQISMFIRTHPNIQLELCNNKFTKDDQDKMIITWKRNIFYLCQTYNFDINQINVKIRANPYKFMTIQTDIFHSYGIISNCGTIQRFLELQKNIIHKEIKDFVATGRHKTNYALLWILYSEINTHKNNSTISKEKNMIKDKNQKKKKKKYSVRSFCEWCKKNITKKKRIIKERL